ncbi:hypothetical protein P689_119207 [Candidatus Riesia pediculischaeffi PTSU]|uniref:Uncharacterized protein n=1 Tax=Candidatus Riesia pediculischaeffi PTSU TaxID=1401651 RepID=A0A0C1SAE0_9ENTR|nr:hypothetical protein P689_119207 [Candidatus Riesia pediculischaeffi PTSU]
MLLIVFNDQSSIESLFFKNFYCSTNRDELMVLIKVEFMI